MKVSSVRKSQEEEPLKTKRENNTGMPDNLKAGVENLSGIDMSDVKVHYNSDKPAEVGALAYTQGTNIHVAPGQERHLPHEAWHVVQQAQGRVKPTMQMKGAVVNNDVGLEHEADEIGARANQRTFFTRGHSYEKNIKKLKSNNINIGTIIQRAKLEFELLTPQIKIGFVSFRLKKNQLNYEGYRYHRNFAVYYDGHYASLTYRDGLYITTVQKEEEPATSPPVAPSSSQQVTTGVSTLPPATPQSVVNYWDSRKVSTLPPATSPPVAPSSSQQVTRGVSTLPPATSPPVAPSSSQQVTTGVSTLPPATSPPVAPSSSQQITRGVSTLPPATSPPVAFPSSYQGKESPGLSEFQIRLEKQIECTPKHCEGNVANAVIKIDAPINTEILVAAKPSHTSSGHSDYRFPFNINGPPEIMHSQIDSEVYLLQEIEEELNKYEQQINRDHPKISIRIYSSNGPCDECKVRFDYLRDKFLRKYNYELIIYTFYSHPPNRAPKRDTNYGWPVDNTERLRSSQVYFHQDVPIKRKVP